MSAELEINQGLVDAAIEIAERRADNLRQLKKALLSNDNELALSLARKLVGISETSNRTFKSLDGGASR
jgi:hypothetical protein